MTFTDPFFCHFVCRYVHKMESSEHSFTIKIKICHLVETLMQHHMMLNIRSEVQFRNQVADCLSLWMRGKVFISENVSHLESLQKLDVIIANRHMRDF